MPVTESKESTNQHIDGRHLLLDSRIANEKPEIARQLRQHLVNFLREFDVDPELQAARAELKL